MSLRASGSTDSTPRDARLLGACSQAAVPARSHPRASRSSIVHPEVDPSSGAFQDHASGIHEEGGRR
jgi:hypothetical protein